MKALLLVVSAVLLSAAPANAAVVTLGSSLAASCYHAARDHVTSRIARQSCDTALSQEALQYEDRVGTYVNRGILRMLSGDLANANRDFDDALAMNGRQPEAWLNKAIAALNGGYSRDAVGMADRALSFGTSRPALAYLVRGLAHEDQGRIKQAYADLVRARELDPKWREPVNELSRYRVRS